MNKLDLSHFKVEQAVIQIEFQPIYLIWDFAGRIWNNIYKKYPALKMKSEPNPNQQSFSIDNEYDLVLELNLFRITSFNPSNLDNFIELVKQCFSIIANVLEIEFIKRLGFRLIFFKDFSSPEALFETFNNLKIIELPQKKLFNIDGKYLYRNLQFKWESEKLGTRVKLSIEKINLNINPPTGWGIDPVDKEKNVFIYDVDYYTITQLKISQLDIESWLNQAQRQIKRESETFFNVK